MKKRFQVFENKLTTLDHTDEIFKDIVKHVIGIEVRPVKVTKNNVEWANDEVKPNAFALYFRLEPNKKFNPSYWIADFDTLEVAKSFANLFHYSIKKSKDIYDYS